MAARTNQADCLLKQKYEHFNGVPKQDPDYHNPIFKMCRIQPKITGHMKKQENHKSHGERQSKDTKDKMIQILALFDKDFKILL